MTTGQKLIAIAIRSSIRVMGKEIADLKAHMYKGIKYNDVDLMSVPLEELMDCRNDAGILLRQVREKYEESRNGDI